MTKKEEQHEARKWQVLSIALDHFIQYGFHGTSTRKIAEDAEISSGLMFHYFPNKAALYEALVEIGCDSMTMNDASEDDPLLFFEHQVENFLALLSQNNFSSKMFVFMGLVAINAKNISEKAERLIRDHDIIENSIPYIEKGQKLGVVRQGDARTLSNVFYGSIQGFAETLAVKPDLKMPDKECFMAIIRA